MASGPITSWQIDRETTETVADFTFLGSKITANSPVVPRALEEKSATTWGLQGNLCPQ